MKSILFKIECVCFRLISFTNKENVPIAVQIIHFVFVSYIPQVHTVLNTTGIIWLISGPVHITNPFTSTIPLCLLRSAPDNHHQRSEGYLLLKCWDKALNSSAESIEAKKTSHETANQKSIIPIHLEKWRS